MKKNESDERKQVSGTYMCVSVCVCVCVCARARVHVCLSVLQA